MLAAGSRGAPMEPGSWPFPRHRRIWTTGFVPPGRIRSGAWSRVSPRQTQCSVVRGLARRDHEVSLHRPADSSACLPPRRHPGPLSTLVAVQVRGPSGARFLSATLDSGSDDTLFPAYIAPRLGIDLAGAPTGDAGGVGGSPILYHYAPVRLRLS